MLILDTKIYSAAPKQEKKDFNFGKNREERQQIYNSNRWQKLRLYYLYSNPICEFCGRAGQVHLHHKRSFIQNGNVSNELAFDESNLEQLCEDCHIKRHNPNKIKNLENINDLLGIK